MALRAEYKALSSEMKVEYETKANAAFKKYENEMRIYKPRLKPQNEKEIGQPCKVYYEHEDTWFLGRIAEYDAQHQQHKVVYVHNGKPEWIPGKVHVLHYYMDTAWNTNTFFLFFFSFPHYTPQSQR